MPRFFLPEGSIQNNTVTFTGEDARHISLSLRMAVGDTLTAVTTDGYEHTCRLTAFTRSEVTAEITESVKSPVEPPYRVTLYQGYPKGDKLELILQKAVELGAFSVVPFESSRCIKRPDPARAERQHERHCRILHDAAMQCGRGILPTVGKTLSFDEMLAAASKHALALFCYEGEGTLAMTELLPEVPPADIAVIVGSEGGFSPEEAERARAAGLSLCGLGRRILRCETAPLFVLSSLLFRYDL